MQARIKFYDVYGEKSLTERQSQNWFAHFRSWDFNFKDAPRSGRPTEVDEDKIKAMIENNRRSTTREIAEKLNISHTCIERQLKQFANVNPLHSCGDSHLPCCLDVAGILRRSRVQRVNKLDTLADPVERTAREYSDRPLTVLWPFSGLALLWPRTIKKHLKHCNYDSVA